MAHFLNSQPSSKNVISYDGDRSNSNKGGGRGLEEVVDESCIVRSSAYYIFILGKKSQWLLMIVCVVDDIYIYIYIYDDDTSDDFLMSSSINSSVIAYL